MTATTLADGARQAALLLHTLAPRDRDWMLSQLTPAQQDEARRLLAELGELGVPSDPSLLRDVLGAATERAPAGGTPAAAVAGRPTVERMSRLPAGTVAALLQQEPDALVARVLRIAAWPWRDAVLDVLGPTRRRRLQDVASNGMAPPRSAALDSALLDTLCARAAGMVPAAGTMPRWPQRLRNRWNHWMHRA